MGNLYKYGCLLLLFTVIFGCRKDVKKENEHIDYQQIDDIFVRNKLAIEKLTLANLNREIISQKVYFGKDSLHLFSMKKLVKKHRFFFYFSEKTCASCIYNTVDCIKEVFPDYEQDDKIIFIAPGYPARMKENTFGKRLLTLTKGKLGIALEEKLVPFLFTVDENLKLKTLHIVNSKDFTETMQYLNTIKEE
ncbi:MAG: hypothetical protein LBR48_03720 [Dysgonamonadaceae bacterium]|jgi:hypothetical protein|nr:hypothetical protein [Dysgonamonadaceae bacterium]